MRGKTVQPIARAAFVASSVGLLVLVAAVGAVALTAELNGTWIWYRRMEKVVAATAEPALALTGVFLLAMAGVALVADR